MEKFILATDWEEVPTDDFYLSKEWNEDEKQKKEAKKLARNKKLYYAYIVSALDYCLYVQMDSNQVFIDDDMNIILLCESAIINNGMRKVIEYEM